MLKKTHTFIAAAILAAGLSTSASAATLTYTNAETTPSMTLVVVDDAPSAGKLRFSLSTTVGKADYLGFGFNFAGTSLTQNDITLVSATKADDAAITPALVLFGNNTGQQSTCGTNCKFNGTMFDYIIRIGENGGGVGGVDFVKSVVFDIATTATLANSPYSGFAVRAQATSNDARRIETSLTQTDMGPVSVVPLPAGLPLLLSGLFAAGLIGRRRKARV